MQMFKSEGRVRELFRKYGKTALATHLTVYAVTFSGNRALQILSKLRFPQSLTLLEHTGLYVAIENHFDPKDLLIRYGLLSG